MVFKAFFDSRRVSRAQFLVAFARLNSRYENSRQSIFVPDYGRMSILGFAKDRHPELFGCATRAEPAAQGMFYSDKFISVRVNETMDFLGGAEVKEAYVYDDHYRSDIDFTGLELAVTLRRSAFDQYERFIGKACVPALLTDQTGWHGDLFIRIPAPIFEFPSGRGSLPLILPREEVRRKSVSFGRSKLSASTPSTSSRLPRGTSLSNSKCRICPTLRLRTCCVFLTGPAHH